MVMLIDYEYEDDNGENPTGKMGILKFDILGCYEPGQDTPPVSAEFHISQCLCMKIDDETPSADEAVVIGDWFDGKIQGDLDLQEEILNKAIDEYNGVQDNS